MSNSPTQQAIQQPQATAMTLKEGAPFPFALSPLPSAKRGHGCQLDRKQEQALAALLSQPSIAQAAIACGLSDSTLYRWLKFPPFQLAYSQARQQTLDTALGHLQHASGQFVTALLQLLADPNASLSVRLGAIRTGLQWSFHHEERRLLQQQILQLQDQVATLSPLPPAEAEPSDLLPLPPLPSVASQSSQLEPLREESPELQSKIPNPKSTIEPEPAQQSLIDNRQSTIENGTALSSAVICPSDEHGDKNPESTTPLSPPTPAAEAGDSPSPSSLAEEPLKQSKIENRQSKIDPPYTYERDERGCWIKVPSVPPPPPSQTEPNPLSSAHQAANNSPSPPKLRDRGAREHTTLPKFGGPGGRGAGGEVSVLLDVAGDHHIHSNVVLSNLDED